MAYGNLAYKYEYAYDEKPQKNKKITNGKKNKETKAAAKRKSLKYITHIGVLAAAAIFMVSSFVTVHDTRKEVSELESQLKEIRAVTDQKAFDLEHSFDLAEIEAEATTRLGMQRPEKYQYVYINVKKEDVIEKAAASGDGLIWHIGRALGSAWSNIVEFFSIK